MDKDLIFSINSVNFFFLRTNSAHISGAGETHQVHAAPCAEGDFLVDLWILPCLVRLLGTTVITEQNMQWRVCS